MVYPKYDFTDPALSYAVVSNTVMEMYSDLLESHKCCGSKQSDQVLSDADLFITGADIDFTLGDTSRYEDNVKAAYLLLYNYVSQ